MRWLPLALALLLLPATAGAYHGEPGGGGWVVEGPAAIEGAVSARAQPGTLAIEGPARVDAIVERGIASVAIVETRERSDAASALLGRSVETREERFEMPAPRILVEAVERSFALALATDGRVAALRLDAPAGVAIAREEAGAAAGAAFGRATREPGVALLASSGTAAADGDFLLLLTGATVTFSAGSATETHRLGAWTEGSERVRRHAVVELRGANVEVPWSGAPGALHAPVVDLDFDGTATLARARGAAAVGDASPVADGGSVAIAGILAASAWPTSDANGLRFEAQGDVTVLVVGATTSSFFRERAAAASLAVLAIGALAAAWPALKSSVLLPLYARIKGGEVMDHDARDRAFAIVKERPGASVLEVADALGIAWSTASYHLAVLEREGFVAGERRGRHRRFFAVGGGASRDAVFATEHPTARRILEAVRASPGASQKDLAAAAGVSASTASWHLERLAKAGLVVATREWRAKRYAPAP